MSGPPLAGEAPLLGAPHPRRLARTGPWRRAARAGGEAPAFMQPPEKKAERQTMNGQAGAVARAQVAACADRGLDAPTLAGGAPLLGAPHPRRLARTGPWRRVARAGGEAPAFMQPPKKMEESHTFAVSRCCPNLSFSSSLLLVAVGALGGLSTFKGYIPLTKKS